MSTINLLPEDYLERRAQQRANILCLLLFTVVMGGVIAAAIVSERNAREVHVQWDQVNREYAEAGRRIAQMQHLESKKREVIAKAEGTSALLERVPRSYLLASLTNALPEGASLTRVELKTTQQRQFTAQPQNKFDAMGNTNSASTSVQVCPLEITLMVEGLAETDLQVAEFIATMEANPLMDSVSLVYSQEAKHQETVVRAFQVTMRLRPNAEVDIDRTRQGRNADAVATIRPADGTGR